jgi:parallel beta-helix repeat protein
MRPTFRLSVGLALILSPLAISRAATLYVSTDGRAGASGTTKEPLPSLAAARDKIRELRRSGDKSAMTVQVRGGTYFLEETFVLTPEDSGAKNAPVTYEAYPGERAILSGGRRITGWTRMEQRQPQRQAQRPRPEQGQAQGQRQRQRPQDGEMGQEQGPRPGQDVAPVSFEFNQLFADGKRVARRRSPAQGFYRIDGAAVKDDPFVFKYRGDTIKKSWAERGDVEVTVICSYHVTRGRITAVDEVAHTVQLAAILSPSCRRNRDLDYYIENAPDAGPGPNGMFYVDGKDGKVQYMGRDDATKQEVIAPFLEQLVRIKGEPENGKLVHDVVFRGLAFRHSEWKLAKDGYRGNQSASIVPAAFEAEGAENVTIDHCMFSQMGNSAISFGRGCYRNRVTGNDIFDIGGGGVKIGELLKDRERPNEAERSGGNVVADNHIHQVGRVFPEANGVLVGQSSDNTISHNHIHDLYDRGISVGWTWRYKLVKLKNNIVEYNHIHDLGQNVMSDLGGVYTLGEQPGTIIRNNLIYNVTGVMYGGWGIYLDEATTGVLVENNVVHDCTHAGFEQHYGRENVVRNNIFAYNRDFQLTRVLADQPLSFTMERNIIYFDRGALMGDSWTGGLKMDHNIYWNTQSPNISFVGKSWKEWQATGMDTHSLIADPLFVNADNFDFRLKPGSPALKMGFEQIDLSTVGPRIVVGPAGLGRM